MQEPAGKIQSNLILYTYTILALCFFCTHGCPHTHSHTFFSSSSAIICEYKYVYFSSAFKHSEVLLLTRSLTCYYSECSSAFDWFSCCRPSGSCFFFPLSVWTPCLFCNQAWWTFNINYKTCMQICRLCFSFESVMWISWTFGVWRFEKVWPFWENRLRKFLKERNQIFFSLQSYRSSR